MSTTNSQQALTQSELDEAALREGLQTQAGIHHLGRMIGLSAIEDGMEREERELREDFCRNQEVIWGKSGMPSEDGDGEQATKIMAARDVHYHMGGSQAPQPAPVQPAPQPLPFHPPQPPQQPQPSTGATLAKWALAAALAGSGVGIPLGIANYVASKPTEVPKYNIGVETSNPE